ARKLSTSIVDTSAQCKSSKKSTTGRCPETCCRNAPSSRFIRSCEAALTSFISFVVSSSSLVSGTTFAYHVGSTCFLTVTQLLSLSTKLSSASNNGRYASVPASRSLHLPRATVQSPFDISSDKNSSTKVVLPIPGSPATHSRRPRPESADSNPARNAARSGSRPTV